MSALDDVARALADARWGDQAAENAGAVPALVMDAQAREVQAARGILTKAIWSNSAGDIERAKDAIELLTMLHQLERNAHAAR